MKVSKEQAAQNRERIVQTAATLFRERGFDGIGVADLMRAAGLTHGGFYGHFESKEDLMAEACGRAMADSLKEWQRRAETTAGNPLAAITKGYLSDAHRDRPGKGCVLAALGPDVARQGSTVRQVVTGGLRNIIDTLSGLIPGRSKAAKREKALAAFAGMTGALVLARAVDDAKFAAEILQAVARSVSNLEKSA